MSLTRIYGNSCKLYTNFNTIFKLRSYNILYKFSHCVFTIQFSIDDSLNVYGAIECGKPLIKELNFFWRYMRNGSQKPPFSLLYFSNWYVFAIDLNFSHEGVFNNSCWINDLKLKQLNFYWNFKRWKTPKIEYFIAVWTLNCKPKTMVYIFSN